MDKKIYVAPGAELMMFVPVEDVAASWQWGWGTYNSENASVTGNVTIFQDSEHSWEYNGTDKPY